MPAQNRTTTKNGSIPRALLKKRARRQKQRHAKRERNLANKTRILDLENELAEVRKEHEDSEEHYREMLSVFAERATKWEKEAKAINFDTVALGKHMVEMMEKQLRALTAYLVGMGDATGGLNVDQMTKAYERVLWEQMIRLGVFSEDICDRLVVADPRGYKRYYKFLCGEVAEHADGGSEQGSTGEKDEASDEDEKMESDEEDDSGTEKEGNDEEGDSTVDLEEEEEGQTKIHKYLQRIHEASDESDDANCCVPPKKVKKNTKKSKKD